MLNIYTKKIEKSLDLSLTVTQDSYIVNSYQPECGDDYSMEFDRSENAEEIAKRIGYEVLSWLVVMVEEFDEDDAEE